MIARHGGDLELPPLDLLSARVFGNYQARSSTAAAKKIAISIFDRSSKSGASGADDDCLRGHETLAHACVTGGHVL